MFAFIDLAAFLFEVRKYITIVHNQNGWIDELRFYVLFNSVSVISGQWEVDNEKLCAMELRLSLAGIELGPLN